jgi:glycosyltransferase involved in cell wall biosynthesis
MKIVHVISALNKGGAEKVAIELANSFSEKGDEVSILSAYPVDVDRHPAAVSHSVELRFVSPEPGGRKRIYWSAFEWLRKNFDWIATRDIIHCHLTFGSAAGTLIVLIRNLKGAHQPKVIETYHAVGMPMPAWERHFHMALAASHDGFVAMASDRLISEFVRSHLKLASAIIPNGIPLPYPVATTDEARAYRRECGLPDGVPVVGTVGRIVPDRRPDEFVEVFAEIARHRSDVHFLMAGDGSELERVRALARELGFLDRLHLPGFVPRPALPFSVIDLYLTLNVGSITGLAGMEAAASGLPLVGVQADKSYQSAEGDWIFSSSSPETVAAEAIRLLASTEERLTLATRQRNYVVNHHSLHSMAEAYGRFYERVLASS